MSAKTTLSRILHNRLVLPLYVPGFFIAFSFGVLGPMMPLHIASLQVSYGLVGLVLAGEGLGALLGDVPSGLLLRRLNPRWMTILGLALALVTVLPLFWVRSVPVILVLRLLAGFGRSMYGMGRHTYIAAAIPLENRGRSVALFGGVNRFGRLFAPALGGFIANVYGLPVIFFMVGSALGLALFVVTLFMRWDFPDAIPVEPSPQKGRLWPALRPHAGVLSAAGAGQLFAQMVRTGRRVIVPLYAADILGLDVSVIGIIESVSSAVDAVMFYPAGLLMDRLGRKFAVVPSFLIMGAGMALIPLTSSYVGLLFVASLLGFGNGLSSGTMLTLGSDLAPKNGQGEFLGVWRLIGDAGVSGGPVVVGAVADLLVLPAAALVMAGCGAAAALVFAVLVPETLSKASTRTARP